jgi:membrane-associated phospholipid phosphatase
MRKARWFPGVAGVGALAIAMATARGRGRDLDERLYRRLNASWGTGVDTFFKGITELGSIWASVGASASMAKAGRRREAVDALGAAGAMWILGQALKRIVVRPRPYRALDDVRLLIEEPRGTSWPSSHPAVLLAFASVATRNLGSSRAVTSGAGLLAGLVGLSRVYLGVHYPADVAGGLLLGRGVADLWSAALSPAILGRLARAPGEATVIG